MSILAFGKSLGQKQRPSACDWSNQEMADFFRAHRLLVQNGASIGLDRGLSDIGEPWLVFYDTTSQDVFLHIARIDSRCVLVCDHLDIRISALSINALVDKFEDRLQQTFSSRAERSSNVVMHPAAKIIMSISAVFLLFKLDSNSQSFAKEMLEPAPENTARKNESIQVRVQAALARLLEGAETPAAMAAIASVILASDIAFDQARQHGNNEGDDALHLELSHEQALQLASVSHLGANGDSQSVEGELPFQHIVQEVAAQAIAEQAPDVDSPILLADDQGHNLIAAIQTLPVDQQPPTSEPALAPASANDAAASTATTKVVLTATPSVTLFSEEPMSVQALQVAMALDFSTLTAQELSTGLLVSAKGDILTLDGDLTFPIATSFGFEAETFFSTDDVLPMLEHILSQLGSYELEMNGNALSIIQMLNTGSDNPGLGMWTNVMSDGSSIAIVGALDLIDDVNTLLAAA